MIELIAAAVSGAVVGGCVVALLAQRNIVTLRELRDDYCRDYHATRRALTALRSNCFIPDERGVKVRYSQASVERRVKAETPRADKV
jgi:hypothetical protein